MWAKFVDLWNKSLYFRGAVAIFVMGLLVMMKKVPSTK
jgi:hypothetical protein